MSADSDGSCVVGLSKQLPHAMNRLCARVCLQNNIKMTADDDGSCVAALICALAILVPQLHSVASPGFVARRGKDGNYVMGTHGGLQVRVQQLLDD